MANSARVFVAGNNGQVARALIERGDARDIAVLSLGRPDIDLEDIHALPQRAVEFAPTIIVNAAAYTAVDKAEDEEDRAFAVNAVGAGNLARAAAELDVPFLHISTDYVFDGSKSEPYVETDPTAPAGAYGRSKLAGEIRVENAAPKHIILRTAWVTSPFGHNFIQTMLRLAGDRDRLRVVADQRGSPTCALDLADAILNIAETIARTGWNDRYSGVFHAAGSGETTWHGLAEAVFAASAKNDGPSVPVDPITTAEFPTPAKRPANSRLDCSKLASVFGIKMPHWRDCAERCVTRLLAERQDAD